MKRKAYFCICIKSPERGPFPVMVSAGIYSSPANQLTVNVSDGTFWVQVMESPEYNNFQEAHDALKNYILTRPEYNWAKVWVSGTEDAHRALYYLTQTHKPG